MEKSVKIGIFRIGVKVSKGILYKAKFFVTMEGWRVRKWRKRVRRIKWERKFDER
jgi:hypothetical protein